MRNDKTRYLILLSMIELELNKQGLTINNYTDSYFKADSKTFIIKLENTYNKNYSCKFSGIIRDGFLCLYSSNGNFLNCTKNI